MVELWNNFEYIWYFDISIYRYIWIYQWNGIIQARNCRFCTISLIWVKIVVDINNQMFRYYFLVHFKTDPHLIFRCPHIFVLQDGIYHITVNYHFWSKFWCFKLHEHVFEILCMRIGIMTSRLLSWVNWAFEKSPTDIGFLYTGVFLSFWLACITLHSKPWHCIFWDLLVMTVIIYGVIV